MVKVVVEFALAGNSSGRLWIRGWLDVRRCGVGAALHGMRRVYGLGAARCVARHYAVHKVPQAESHKLGIERPV